MKNNSFFAFLILGTSLILASCTTSQLSFDKRKYNSGFHLASAHKDKASGKQKSAENPSSLDQAIATPTISASIETEPIPTKIDIFQSAQEKNKEAETTNELGNLTSETSLSNLELKDLVKMAVQIKHTSDALKESKLFKSKNKSRNQQEGQNRRGRGGKGIFILGLLLGSILILTGIIIYAVNAGNPTKTTAGAIILFVGLGVILLGALLSWIF